MELYIYGLLIQQLNLNSLPQNSAKHFGWDGGRDGGVKRKIEGAREVEGVEGAREIEGAGEVVNGSSGLIPAKMKNKKGGHGGPINAMPLMAAGLINPMVTPPLPILSQASTVPQPVPTPVPAPSSPSSAPLFLKECLGIVTNLINDNYGVAAVTLPGPPDLGLSGPYLVLFDTCEFWVDSTVVSDADIPLSEVTTVGDMIKINAIQVDNDNARNIKYLATAVMTSGDLEDLIQTKFHKSVAFIKDVKDVSNDKLTNFKVVVDFLNNQAVDSKEKDAVEQSTKLAEKIFASVSGSSTSASGTVPPPLNLQYPSPTLPAPYPCLPFPLNPAMPPLMAPMMPPFPFPGFPPFPGATPRAAESGPAREKLTYLPPKMIYWNDNLIRNLDSSGAYIDCVYCRETVAIKPGDKLAPYYLDHYASESHNMMVKRIVVDQIVVLNYLSERVMLPILMRKEEAAGKAVVFHKYDDIVFYRCKHWHCQDLVTSAWHFRNMLKSPKHKMEGFSCKLCGINTTCKEDLEIHLIGKKHKRELNALEYWSTRVLEAHDPVMNQDPVSKSQTVSLDKSLMTTAPSLVPTEVTPPVSIQTIKVTCNEDLEAHDPVMNQDPVSNSQTVSPDKSLMTTDPSQKPEATPMKKLEPAPVKNTEPAEAKEVERGSGEPKRLCSFFAMFGECHRKNCQLSHVLHRAKDNSVHRNATQKL